MDPLLFQEDLEAKPRILRDFASHVDRSWDGITFNSLGSIVFLGMGSSHFANSIGAARLRAHGLNATAALASTDLLPAVSSTDVVIAVSASGGSTETLAAVESYKGSVPVIAVTNKDSASDSAIGQLADAHVPMRAETERGGVACRSFQHTLALLLALEARLVPSSSIAHRGVGDLVRASADTSEDLLHGSWLERVSESLLGPQGSSFVAPARRLSSAQQSALMLREGPRLSAIGCETGDWSHIDVYLTKTTDYRMLLFAGAPRWEPQLMDWCTQRGSTVIAAGADVPGVRDTIRYLHDDDDDVRLLNETLIAEMIAARAWLSV